MTEPLSVRTSVQPGDLERIVRLHHDVYSREFGFDSTFDTYVAEPLARFLAAISERERLWVAERNGAAVGCVAIVQDTATTARLRWFVVHPSARGQGLGSRLLREAIDFCESAGYERIILWTVDVLRAAARRYLAAGFARTEAVPARLWGVDLVEEKYERSCSPAADHSAARTAPA